MKKPIFGAVGAFFGSPFAVVIPPKRQEAIEFGCLDYLGSTVDIVVSGVNICNSDCHQYSPPPTATYFTLTGLSGVNGVITLTRTGTYRWTATVGSVLYNYNAIEDCPAEFDFPSTAPVQWLLTCDEASLGITLGAGTSAGSDPAGMIFGVFGGSGTVNTIISNIPCGDLIGGGSATF